MILCKDCKHCDLERVWCEKYRDYLNSTDEISCIHAERADGLTVCCQTCVHYTFPKNRWTDEQCNKDYFFINSEGETGYCRIDVDKMSCPEWQAREGR